MQRHSHCYFFLLSLTEHSCFIFLGWNTIFILFICELETKLKRKNPMVSVSHNPMQLFIENIGVIWLIRYSIFNEQFYLIKLSIFFFFFFKIFLLPLVNQSLDRTLICTSLFNFVHAAIRLTMVYGTKC
jgi:hypothetical protein